MSTTTPHDATSDEAVLESFGYKQELRRSLSLWTNFAVGFAYISPVVGLYAIIALATFAAGPAWFWALPIVLAGQLLVACVFAELASQFPIAGGIYQWSRRLVGPTYAWFAGWLYVWTIMLTVTAIAYFGAVWLAGLFDVTPSPSQQVLWAFAILVVTTLVNGNRPEPAQVRRQRRHRRRVHRQRADRRPAAAVLPPPPDLLPVGGAGRRGELRRQLPRRLRRRRRDRRLGVRRVRLMRLGVRGDGRPDAPRPARDPLLALLGGRGDHPQRDRHRPVVQGHPVDHLGRRAGPGHAGGDRRVRLVGGEAVRDRRAGRVHRLRDRGAG